MRCQLERLGWTIRLAVESLDCHVLRREIIGSWVKGTKAAMHKASIGRALLRISAAVFAAYQQSLSVAFRDYLQGCVVDWLAQTTASTLYRWQETCSKAQELLSAATLEHLMAAETAEQKLSEHLEWTQLQLQEISLHCLSRHLGQIFKGASCIEPA